MATSKKKKAPVKKVAEKKETFKGVSLVNRSCHLGGKDYKFIKGKVYTILDKEVFTKLTNNLNRVLELVE